MTVLNKTALISEIAEATGSTKAATERFLNAFQDSVVDSVARGEEVKLTGFAVFSPVTRAARIMKNPRTGEDLAVAEAKSVKIRPLKHFRDAITAAPAE
jgi:DNA-binding protein HU-beta